MRIIGLIAEYNPFHNGHLYQINKIKEMYPNSIIVCVLSTSFSQRGEVSLLNKWEKTTIALNNNIDIVVELPYLFTVQSADVFAHASMQMLNQFKIDTLIFGSETNDIEKLKQIAIKSKETNQEYKDLLKKGYSYPSILSRLYPTSKNPNDILGIAYIRVIIKNSYSIEPISIKRTNEYHDTKLNNIIVSASNIRKKYYDNIDIKNFVPKDTHNILKDKNVNRNLFFDLIKYKVSTHNNLNEFLDVDEGIENRIVKSIYNYNNEDGIIKSIKSKRYTYSKIYRMLNHILIGLTKKDATTIKDIEYIRILGFNKNGKDYLSRIKKEFEYPLIYNTNKESKISKYELVSTKIYSLICNDKGLIDKEFKKNVIIK